MLATKVVYVSPTCNCLTSRMIEFIKKLGFPRVEFRYQFWSHFCPQWPGTFLLVSLQTMSSPPFTAYLPDRTRVQRSRRATNNSLPVFANGSSAVQEKLALHIHNTPWWFRIAIPVPFIHRSLRFSVLNPRKVHDFAAARFGRKRGCLVLVMFFMLAFFSIFALARRFGTHAKQWSLSKDTRTLVYRQADLQKIWMWEIASGHYPSRKASAS